MGGNCVSLNSATSIKEMADRKSAGRSQGKGKTVSKPINRKHVENERSTIEKHGITGKSKATVKPGSSSHSKESTYSSGKQSSPHNGKDNKVTTAYDKDQLTYSRDNKPARQQGNDSYFWEEDTSGRYNAKTGYSSGSSYGYGGGYSTAAVKQGSYGHSKESTYVSGTQSSPQNEKDNKVRTRGNGGAKDNKYSNPSAHDSDKAQTTAYDKDKPTYSRDNKPARHQGNDPYFREEGTGGRYNTKTGYSSGSSYGYPYGGGYSTHYYDDDRESSESDDERPSYRTKIKKRGLTNLGATCYMNSAIQALNICSGFRDAVLQENIDVSNKTQHELWKLFKSLKKKKSSSKTPGSFYRVAKPAWFAHGQQQDSSVFLRNLLSNVDDEGGPISRLVQEKFRIHLNDVYKCKSCKKMSKVPDNLLDLMLPFPMESYSSTISGFLRGKSRISVQDMLQDFLSPEHPRDEEETECRFCYRMTRREVSAEIMHLPEYLILTIPRFGDTGTIKNTTTVDYPEWITVPVQSKQQDEWYVIVAVIVHSGSSTLGGHYYSYGREDEDKNEWYKFNDSFVDGGQRQFEERQGGSCTACVVIYKRQPSHKVADMPPKSKSQVQEMEIDENSQDYYNPSYETANSSNHINYTAEASVRNPISPTLSEINQGSDNHSSVYAADREFDKMSPSNSQHRNVNNEHSNRRVQHIGTGVAGCLNYDHNIN